MKLAHRLMLRGGTCAVWFFLVAMAHAQSAIPADRSVAPPPHAGVTGTPEYHVRQATSELGVDVGRHESAGARADVDGIVPISDDNTSERIPSRPALLADEPRANCAGCGDCTCDACDDGRVSVCELANYACAWRAGCTNDLASVIRVAFVWQLGGVFCWDQSSARWMPEPASRSAPGLCLTSNEPAGIAADLMADEGANTATMRLLRLRSFGAPRGLSAGIAISAAAGTVAVGLEVVVPDGWAVDTISDGGVWDGLNRKVKWGPFFTDLSRRMHFTAWRASGKWSVDGFLGTASFDGFNVPVVVVPTRSG